MNQSTDNFMDGISKTAHKKESFLDRILNFIKPQNSNDLDEVIHDAGERDIIDETTEDMLHGVFDIARLRLDDIMIPRKDIVAISADISIEEAIRQVAESGHSRYPVIDGDKDHVVGILMAKDLLPYALTQKRDQSIRSLLRTPIIVPESKRADTMLKEFQANRFHIAIVVDEFGGVCGLVTIEDILELIVGDINDEYDISTGDERLIIKKKKSDVYWVKGTTPIEVFEEYFNTELADVDADTVAGYVLHAFGRFPEKNESIAIAGFEFKILRASQQQILIMQVKQIKEDSQSES